LPPLSNQIVSDRIEYTLKRGDHFIKLGARYGVGSTIIAAENNLDRTTRLTAGNKLILDNRHIVPHGYDNGIIVNIPQRMLFYFKDGKLQGAYPAAVGRVAPQWRTPLGPFKVVQLRKFPTWRVPASIRQEMIAAGEEPESSVPPGPDNPLGDYWIGLSRDSLGIHSTNSPLGIYGFHTHGCMRVAPANAEKLFQWVAMGEKGEIIYLPVLMARSDDGRVFLEINPDGYQRGIGGMAYVKGLAEANHLSDLIDWAKAVGVVDRAEGIARDVTSVSAGEAKR